MLQRRLSLNIRCEKTVFELIPSPKPISLRSIDDCIEIANYYDMKQKHEYFESFNCDYDNVVKYYPIVKRLNKAFYEEKKEEKNKLNMAAIAFLFALSYIFR